MRASLVEDSRAALLSLLANLPPARPAAEGFSVESFVADLLTLQESETTMGLETLCKKIEVSRRLRLFYSTDLSKPLSEETPASGYAEALAAAFLHFGLARGDWKWLNTVLKMEWGILLSPTFVLPGSLSPILSEALGDRL